MSGSCAVEPRQVDTISTDSIAAGDDEAPIATPPERQPDDAIVK